MATGDLFTIEEIRQCRGTLTTEKREKVIAELVKKAVMGIKYFYSLRETCALLHISYDELKTIVSRYKVDIVLFLSVYRIPWYDLAGYLLDDETDDLEEALYEYLDTISKKRITSDPL